MDVDNTFENLQYSVFYTFDFVLNIEDVTFLLNLDNPTEKIYISHMTGYEGEDLQVLPDEFGPSDDCHTKIFSYEVQKPCRLGFILENSIFINLELHIVINPATIIKYMYECI